MLIYSLSAAGLSVVVSLTQGPDCTRLRKWLAGMAALLLLIPALTALVQRFPNKGWNTVRVLLGFLFYFWVLSAIPWAWMKTDEPCPVYNLPWLFSTVLLSIHVAFLGLQVIRFSGRLCRGGRRTAFIWIKQLAPFMDVF